VETAIPCGLVINELVTNAFKHAFPAGRHGAIRVVLREVDPSRCLVAVEDDGIGLPAQISLGKTDSLGLDLVSILANQLRSAVEVALYRHEMDARLRERERWFSTTLRSIGDAVISTDLEARVTFMNTVAETLTGWRTEDAVGRPLEEVLRLSQEDTHE